jgi:hypothetical protein
LNSYKYALKVAKRIEEEAESVSGGTNYLASQLRCAIRDIERLSAQLEQVTRERDAAIKDIDRWCGTCKRSYLNDDTVDICKYAKECNKCNYWQWRGVQEVE